MATATNNFPLATDTNSPDPYGGYDPTTNSGASGSSNGAIYLPEGGMIAIVVVVALVALLAGMSNSPFHSSLAQSLDVKPNAASYIQSALVCYFTSPRNEKLGSELSFANQPEKLYRR